jgi:hypothetical protein
MPVPILDKEPIVGTNVNLTLEKVEVEARAAIGGARKRRGQRSRP